MLPSQSVTLQTSDSAGYTSIVGFSVEVNNHTLDISIDLAAINNTISIRYKDMSWEFTAKDNTYLFKGCSPSSTKSVLTGLMIDAGIVLNNNAVSPIHYSLFMGMLHGLSVLADYFDENPPTFVEFSNESER